MDKVTFLAGIDPADVSVKRLSNSDLEITFAGTTDKLTIERYFSNYYKNSSWNTGADSNVVEELHFADGTIWTTATIKEKVRTMHGTENGETLQGFGDQQNLLYAGAGDDALYAGGMSGDKLYGEDGNDVLYGSWASETLDGGAGNDRMEGSAGDDTYVFGLGYGQDVIYDSNQGQGTNLDKVIFLEGINPSDVTAKRLSNSDLELTFAGSSDKLTIERYFSNYYKNSSWNTGTDSNAIEEFHFADNTVWDIDDIKAMVRTINGTENGEVLYGYEDADTITAGGGDDSVYAGYGNDVISGGSGDDALYGEDGNDVLDGGTGNDHLDGGYGDDTYIFSGTFGNDQINDYYGNNRLAAESAVKSILEKFSPERVAYVLAQTIQQKDHDGRISPDCKEWAKGMDGSPDHAAHLIIDSVNPGLVSLFTEEFVRQTAISRTQEQAPAEQSKPAVPEKAPEAPAPKEPEQAVPVKHRLTPEEKKIKEAVMDTLKAQIAGRNDGMLSTYRSSNQSFKVMVEYKVRIEGNTVTRDGEPMFTIHRRHSAKKVQGCYRELTPTLEYIGKEKTQEAAREKPSIREQLRAAAKSQPERKTPVKQKSHDVGLE